MIPFRKDKKIRILAGLIIAIFVLAVFLLGKPKEHPPAPRERPPIAEEGGVKFIANEILVKFKEGTPPDLIDEVHLKIGGKVTDSIPQIGVEVVEVPASELKEKLKAYNDNPDVEYAEVNYFEEFISPLEPVE